MVIGGGVIGCEYACTFAVLDVDVSLVHNKDILLPFMDHDISIALEESMSKMGINLIKPENVEFCTVNANKIKIKLGSGKTCTPEAVMLATGRTSNSGELNL